MRLSVLVMLAGCDGVFNLDRIPVRDAHADDGQPDARPGCTVDRFADGVTGVLGRWNRTAESAGVEITIDADQVVARVAADATGIAELDSLRKFDMTGAMATLEIRAVLAPPNVETYFDLDLDDRNFYSFDIADDSLLMFTQIQGTNASAAAIKYDPVAHWFLRFQHDVAAGRVQFLTSATGADGSWSIRHMIDANVPLGAMTIELGAGVYNAGSPAAREARFDNFEFCPP